jgi:hypothetical protein
MAAKYMVTIPPGAPVAGVGFVKPGEIFSAPTDDYVPSRSFRAVNEEGRAKLEKLYSEIGTALEKRQKDAKPEDKAALHVQLEKLDQDAKRHLTVVELAQEEPKVERGLTLAELARLDNKDQPSKPPPTTPAPSGKRAADK